MAANGYGAGNLPMDLYKMVYHDNWDYNGRADGQGDYTPWGISKIRVLYYTSTNDGRDIYDGDKFVASIDPNYQCLWVSGDRCCFTDGGFYWVVDGDMYMDADYICNDQGGDDWDYYD